MNVIYILWKRELLRYFRSRARLVGSLGQPLLFLVALGFGLGPIFQKAGQGNYFEFLAPGVVSMGILFTGIFAGIQVIWDRQFGFLKETLVAPVSRFEIVLGKTLGGATVAFIQGLIVLLLTLLIGVKVYSWVLFPVALLSMFLIAVLFTGIGITLASLFEDMQGFQLVMNFVVQPTFFLSGALFPLQGLPDVIVLLSSLNPLAYGVDGLRGALVNQVYFGFSIDLLVLSGVSALFLVIGSYLFSKIQI